MNVSDKDLENIILKEADKMLDEIADFIFSESQQNLVDGENGNPISDTGALLNSGNVNREFLKKEIVYTAPHAMPVNYGTQPFMMKIVERTVNKKVVKVPIIYDWAVRKLQISPREAVNVSWAIANHIKQHGIKPTFFFDKAVDAAKAKFK